MSDSAVMQDIYDSDINLLVVENIYARRLSFFLLLV